MLVKVINEAGVTHRLTVSGPYIGSGKRLSKEEWLTARVETIPPDRRKLSGQKVEYLALRLTPHATGKREATLTFDVGQGSQDLGFRAEVPVLFSVLRTRPKRLPAPGKRVFRTALHLIQGQRPMVLPSPCGRSQAGSLLAKHGCGRFGQMRGGLVIFSLAIVSQSQDPVRFFLPLSVANASR